MQILSHDGFNEVDDIKPIKKKAKKKYRFSAFLKKASKQIKHEIKSFKELYKYIKSSKANKSRRSYSKTKTAYQCRRYAVRKSRLSFKAVATPICALAIIAMAVCFTSVTKFSPKADTVKATNENTPLISQTATEYELTPEKFNESVANMGSSNICAYGLFVDGVCVGAVSDKTELENALNTILAEAVGRYDETTVTRFYNDVQIKETVVDSSTVCGVSEVIAKAKDSFSIELTTDYEVLTDIDYEVEYVYDDEQYTDYEEITTPGKAGSARTLYKLVFVDGVQTDLVYDSFEIVEEPTTQVVTIGTKEPEIVSGTPTGNFMWPVPYTTNITSGYGWRWGSLHTGIDIAAANCYGQSIVASDGGIVEWAGYDDSGYGNYVIIDHGNGYKTLYGHCSELYVSAGQSVAQGASIAAIGSTGYSTGPHLHFEVRQNGERLDPSLFV